MAGQLVWTTGEREREKEGSPRKCEVLLKGRASPRRKTLQCRWANRRRKNNNMDLGPVGCSASGRIAQDCGEVQYRTVPYGLGYRARHNPVYTAISLPRTTNECIIYTRHSLFLNLPLSLSHLGTTPSPTLSAGPAVETASSMQTPYGRVQRRDLRRKQLFARETATR